MQSTADTLTILVASDVHMSVRYLEALKQWHQANLTKYDYVLIPGDTSNLEYNLPETLAASRQQ